MPVPIALGMKKRAAEIRCPKKLWRSQQRAILAQCLIIDAAQRGIRLKP